MTATFPIVSSSWLVTNGANPAVVILESSVFMERGTASSPEPRFRSGAEEFESEGRVPGARFADLFEDFSDPDAALPFTRPTVTQFNTAAGRLGITPETHVVIYDRLAGQWASRLWWVFRSFGHENVSVLDGGFKKYSREGLPIETGFPLPIESKKYQSKDINEFVAFRSDVREIVEGRVPASLVCLLKPDDYSGNVPVRSRAGHIPGSVNLPFTELLNSDDNTLRGGDELREAFASVVPLDGRTIITYCGGGIASTLGALALAVIGYANTMEYDGSLVDWISDPQSPLEIG
ncbi:thiosulfate/3-mercaptopyruvate sulfurtransferase [Rhizobium sp. BIGb0125]|jgi:thiosulfate/3-mercaptopyruvate sulfurtransferase|uniref:sulfurtransferase n=1 Tax=Rhizobium sp. BIGb0125 TaxID=2940618 RepID=UPI002166FB43|nr:sulfurtransferase [Rhizobium sp. BIGb0125]MCS4244085.1 thiosulfate/3-mercaptopyruvate sulfurtransferase [Rhizobium sp. BIGb0125]